ARRGDARARRHVDVEGGRTLGHAPADVDPALAGADRHLLGPGPGGAAGRPTGVPAAARKGEQDDRALPHSPPVVGLSTPAPPANRTRGELVSIARAATPGEPGRPDDASVQVAPPSRLLSRMGAWPSAAKAPAYTIPVSVGSTASEVT